MSTQLRNRIGQIKNATRHFFARFSQLFFPFQFPAGHYYSPITHPKEIENDKASIFHFPEYVPGVDLRFDAQKQWLHRMVEAYAHHPFTQLKTQKNRYYFDNVHFAEADALALFAFLKLNKPKKVIEVGSGYSSAVMLDTVDILSKVQTIQLQFIEPYPKRLYSILKPEDTKKHSITVSRIQDVDLAIFDTLQDGDLLFIDSTHVSKTGSDVNFVFFEILPRLKAGVFVHFHDIFYPFEYPYSWVKGKGFGWNENYILRAFLQFNSHFQIEYFGHYILTKEAEWVGRHMPLMLNNTGGSIYLRKIEYQKTQ